MYTSSRSFFGGMYVFFLYLDAGVLLFGTPLLLFLLETEQSFFFWVFTCFMLKLDRRSSSGYLHVFFCLWTQALFVGISTCLCLASGHRRFCSWCLHVLLPLDTGVLRFSSGYIHAFVFCIWTRAFFFEVFTRFFFKSLNTSVLVRGVYYIICTFFFICLVVVVVVSLSTFVDQAKPVRDSPELFAACFRCGASNPLLSPFTAMSSLSSSMTSSSNTQAPSSSRSRHDARAPWGDACTTCRHPFVRSFFNFESLPLVEFQPGPGYLYRTYSTSSSACVGCVFGLASLR